MIKKIRTFLARRTLVSHVGALQVVYGSPRLSLESVRRLLESEEIDRGSLTRLLMRAEVDDELLLEFVRRAEDDDLLLRLVEFAKVGGEPLAMLYERAKTDSAFAAMLAKQMRLRAREYAIRQETYRRRSIAEELARLNPELRQVFGTFLEENSFTKDEKEQIEIMLLQLMPDDKSRSELFAPLVSLVDEIPGAELNSRYLKQLTEASVARAVAEHVDATAFKPVFWQGEETEISSLREEAEKIDSDEFLRLEWDARNDDIGRIYTILGPPPLRTLSGVPHER